MTLHFLGSPVLAGEADLREAASCMERCEALIEQTRFQDALEPARCAYEIRSEQLGEGDPKTADAALALALSLRETGDLAAALPLFQQAVVIYEKTPDSSVSLFNAMNELAICVAFRGEPGAEDWIQRSLALDGISQVPKRDRAAALNNLASFAGASVRSDSLLGDALALLDDDGDRARVLHQRALFATQMNDHSKALQIMGEVLALDLRLLGPDDKRIAEDLNVLGTAHWNRGSNSSAESCFVAALRITENALGPSHPAALIDGLVLGRLYLSTGRHARAVQVLEQVAARYEEARLRMGTGIVRATFVDSPYDDLAAALLHVGRGADAWMAAEARSGRVLAELVDATDPAGLPVKDRERRRAIRLRLQQLQQEAVASSRSEPARDTREQLRLQEELRKIEARFARGMGSVDASRLLARVQRWLASNSALIGWLEISDGEAWSGWGYVIRRSGPVQWVPLPRTGEPPGPEFKRLRAQLAAPLPASEFAGESSDAEELYELAIAPLVPHLGGVTDLVVLPSGLLHGVPVEVLRDGEGRLVGDAFNVNYHLSATLFAWHGEQDASRGRNRPGLFVGNPRMSAAPSPAVAGASDERNLWQKIAGLGAGWAQSRQRILRGVVAGEVAALDSLPPLPASQQEVMACSALLPGSRVLVDAEASESSLQDLASKQSLRDYSTLHFATHAIADEQHPDRSLLVLSRPTVTEAQTDGVITALEIVRDWNLDAAMVVLSGCETGLGRDVEGEGYVGLAHAMFQAGAQCLLVSLWQVEDESTSRLMHRFYENWTGRFSGSRDGGVGPMSRGRALREAKRWLRDWKDASGRQPYAHPFFWSGFILLGDAR